MSNSFVRSQLVTNELKKALHLGPQRTKCYKSLNRKQISIKS